jgi:hypothetical protein
VAVQHEQGLEAPGGHLEAAMSSALSPLPGKSLGTLLVLQLGDLVGASLAGSLISPTHRGLSDASNL